MICEPVFLGCTTSMQEGSPASAAGERAGGDALCFPVLPNDAQKPGLIKNPITPQRSLRLGTLPLCPRRGQCLSSKSKVSPGPLCLCSSGAAAAATRQHSETDTAWEHHSYSFWLLCIRWLPMSNLVAVGGRNVL